MIEYVKDTGDDGQLKIEDKTDDSDLMTVELWLKSSSPVSVPELPWAYSVDGAGTSWRSFNFTDTTLWQRIHIAHVGTSETFTMHLGDTNTSQLEGPTDLEINLAGYVEPDGSQSGLVDVRVDGSWKKAVPYVRHGGSWKKAQAFVKTSQGWEPVA